MDILVTGSNGFIGSHTAQLLREKGNRVTGLGRHGQPLFEVDDYICCDLSSEESFKNLSGSGKKFDAVVHLAADMRREPHNVTVVTANCGGTQRLLEYCEESGVKAFVQLSSLPVIGKPVQHPITEEHPLCPPTVYHATKIEQELLADYAYRIHGLRTCSMRISAPVGRGMNPRTIFPVFVKQALAGETLELAGKGTRKQTYIAVRDIAEAIYAALNSDAHGVYNLVSYNTVSNLELAEAIVKYTNSASQIVFSGKEDYMDDYIWDADISRLKTDTGWEPAVGLEEMIREMAQILGEQ